MKSSRPDSVSAGTVSERPGVGQVPNTCAGTGGPDSKHCRLGVVASACNPSTLEAETEGSLWACIARAAYKILSQNQKTKQEVTHTHYIYIIVYLVHAYSVSTTPTLSRPPNLSPSKLHVFILSSSSLLIISSIHWAWPPSSSHLLKEQVTLPLSDIINCQ